MKTPLMHFSIFQHLLRPTLTKSALLLAIVVTVAAFKAPNGNGSYKLGGTWVGRLPGQLGDVTWITTYSPDSSGKNAKLTTEWITRGDFELLDMSLGVERISIASGYMHMTGKDTAVMKAMWYGAGPKPDGGLDEIKTIVVLAGDVRFTGPTTSVGTYHMKVYATAGNPSMIPTDDMMVVFDSDRDLPEPIQSVNDIVF